MVFTNNKVYNVLKWIAQVVLPALGTLYFTIAKAWSLPCPNEVVGTISAIDLFLGALLGISSRAYQGEGTIMYNPTTGNANLDISTNMYNGGEKMIMVKLIQTDEDIDTNG